MPRYFAMGNTCPFKARAGSQSKMTSPRNLDELLEDLSDIQKDDLDATIEQNTWAKKFREFLRSKDLTEHEIFLNFLVLTQALVNADKQLMQSKLSQTKKEALGDLQKEVFRIAVTKHFAEDCVQPIGLDNETVLGYLSSIDLKNLKVTEEELAYLRKARKDLNVWDEGLVPVCLQFLKQASPSVVACLLSIL